MGAPLAVEAGLKVPHGEAAQVAVQLTPTPLLVVALMDAVAPVVSEGGWPLRETVVGGGVLLEPPQPFSKSARVAMARKEAF